MAKTGGRLKSRRGPTKTELCEQLAEVSGVIKADVKKVLDALGDVIERSIGRNDTDSVTIPGLVKIAKVRKPAVKAHTRPNPFKPDEIMEIKAKPASVAIKVRALKALKDMVS